jgi:FemAB-related protein (PEP-CTERM system-associated)
MSVAGARVAVTPAFDVREDAPPPECDSFVDRHPEGSSYHRPAWLGVVSRAFGHETRYLSARAGSCIVGVLPVVLFRTPLFGRFAVSMPFFNYGGVLADDPAIEQALLDHATHVVERAGGRYLELRHLRQRFDLPSKRHKVAMRLPLLRTPEDQWNALDKKIRNQVRKAQKSGLTAESGGAELLPAFYEVFARNMRDLGTPVYARGFFREVVSAFPAHTRIFVVRHEQRPVAASLVHWHGQICEVPWASSLRESNPLCANVLLYWEMLQFAIGGGCRTLDFGRSTPGAGTFHFKRQWGAEPHPMVWEYWARDRGAVPDLSPANPRFSLAVRAWQRLPVRVASAVGPLIVRNIP